MRLWKVCDRLYPRFKSRHEARNADTATRLDLTNSGDEGSDFNPPRQGTVTRKQLIEMTAKQPTDTTAKSDVRWRFSKYRRHSRSRSLPLNCC